MNTFSVTVGCCTYKSVMTRAVYSHFALEKCPDPKITVRYQDGDALIGRSRSILTTNWLEKTTDELFMFLDEDIIISTEDATKLMWEAYQLKLPIVGAAYVTKSKENPGFAVKPLGFTKLDFGTKGQIYPMEYISTGCMVIRREVFEAMVKSEKIHACKGASGKYYPFFQDKQMFIVPQQMFEKQTRIKALMVNCARWITCELTKEEIFILAENYNKKYCSPELTVKEVFEILESLIASGEWEHLSEDWFFCKLARELGFTVHCDTTIKLGHIGFYEYDWNDVLDVKSGRRIKADAPTFHMNGGLKEDIQGTKKMEVDINLTGKIEKDKTPILRNFDFRGNLRKLVGV